MLLHCRPGFARLSLPFFLNAEAVQFALEAVEMAAEHGWKLLPQVGVAFQMTLIPSFSFVLYLNTNVNDRFIASEIIEAESVLAGPLFIPVHG